MLQQVIIREVMRLSGAHLLHIAAQAKEPLSTAISLAIPLISPPQFILRPSPPCFSDSAEKQSRCAHVDAVQNSKHLSCIEASNAQKHGVLKKRPDDCKDQATTQVANTIDDQARIPEGLEHKLRALSVAAVQGFTDESGAAEYREEVCGKTFVAYDLLVLTGGMHDAALQKLGIRSWGLSDCSNSIQHVAELPSRIGGYENAHQWVPNCPTHNEVPRELRKVNGCISAADPHLHELLGESGPFLTPLRWNPLASVVVYGRSLDAFCLVQGLIKRDVPPQKISLVLPPRYRLLLMLFLKTDELIEVDEFSTEAQMGLQLLQLLHQIGVRVHTNVLLHDIVTDSQGKLKGALFTNASDSTSTGGEPTRQQQVVKTPFPEPCCPCEHLAKPAFDLPLRSPLYFPYLQSGSPGPPMTPFCNAEDTQQMWCSAYQYLVDEWEPQEDGEPQRGLLPLAHLRIVAKKLMGFSCCSSWYAGHGLARSHSLTSLRSFDPAASSGTAAAFDTVSAVGLSSAMGKCKFLPCRVLLTADRQDIDWDLLQAVQGAGLVYDGRMIVHHDFSVRRKDITPSEVPRICPACRCFRAARDN
ncbi:uncharacterized protein LOC113147347 [Cyclospora cayetanensis]|uniref:Uncharacterized protein LOC113147347 n=1 Tax=Cyclospora cayetanensis TaxID=88456 RepID=A0A6P6RZM0_9EIME|nr:uncharacterized protein LOC113147347 [Cyclospora cayetanensis]